MHLQSPYPENTTSPLNNNGGFEKASVPDHRWSARWRYRDQDDGDIRHESHPSAGWPIPSIHRTSCSFLIGGVGGQCKECINFPPYSTKKNTFKSPLNVFASGHQKKTAKDLQAQTTQGMVAIRLILLDIPTLSIGWHGLYMFTAERACQPWHHAFAIA